MAREINLVPDIKGEMIKALKMRNLIFFICIMASLFSVAVIVVFALISTSQQSVVNGKRSTLDALSAKITGYEDLSEYLTVKDQLGNLATISENKNVLLRVFSLLTALLPTNGDEIKVSELNVDFNAEYPTITFDGQADAKTSPFIDYNVLEAFKKSMQYMRYDYGDYVDKNGEIIPAYCMIESGDDGATLSDATNGYYAYWLINGEGCNPSAKNTQSLDDEGTSSSTQSNATIDYPTENYNGQTVVKIWRTPQFETWRKTSNMDLDGTISGVPHFESKCTTYSGAINSTTNTVNWGSKNENCVLIVNAYETSDTDRPIGNTSNGRGANDELVARFSANLKVSAEFFSFKNNHVLAVGPTGRYNVTDSYVQIQNMFGQRASDCAENDTACNNSNGGS